MNHAEMIAEWQLRQCYKCGHDWRSLRSVLGTGCMEVFDAEPWVIRLAV